MSVQIRFAELPKIIEGKLGQLAKTIASLPAALTAYQQRLWSEEQAASQSLADLRAKTSACQQQIAAASSAESEAAQLQVSLVVLQEESIQLRRELDQVATMRNELQQLEAALLEAEEKNRRLTRAAQRAEREQREQRTKSKAQAEARAEAQARAQAEAQQAEEAERARKAERAEAERAKAERMPVAEELPPFEPPTEVRQYGREDAETLRNWADSNEVKQLRRLLDEDPAVQRAALAWIKDNFSLQRTYEILAFIGEYPSAYTELDQIVQKIASDEGARHVQEVAQAFLSLDGPLRAIPKGKTVSALTDAPPSYLDLNFLNERIATKPWLVRESVANWYVKDGTWANPVMRPAPISQTDLELLARDWSTFSKQFELYGYVIEQLTSPIRTIQDPSGELRYALDPKGAWQIGLQPAQLYSLLELTGQRLSDPALHGINTSPQKLFQYLGQPELRRPISYWLWRAAERGDYEPHEPKAFLPRVEQIAAPVSAPGAESWWTRLTGSKPQLKEAPPLQGPEPQLRPEIKPPRKTPVEWQQLWQEYAQRTARERAWEAARAKRAREQQARGAPFFGMPRTATPAETEAAAQAEQRWRQDAEARRKRAEDEARKRAEAAAKQRAQEDAERWRRAEETVQAARRGQVAAAKDNANPFFGLRPEQVFPTFNRSMSSDSDRPRWMRFYRTMAKTVHPDKAPNYPFVASRLTKAATASGAEKQRLEEEIQFYRDVMDHLFKHHLGALAAYVANPQDKRVLEVLMKPDNRVIRAPPQLSDSNPFVDLLAVTGQR